MMDASNKSKEADTKSVTDTEDPGQVLDKNRKPLYVKKFVQPDSDDEDLIGDEHRLFNVTESWRTLVNLPSCQRVMITEPIQRELKIIVGVNVTQEFPWKQVKYEDLRNHLFDELENTQELEKLFKGFPLENYILIGFAPILTEQDDDPPEGDPFVFYISSKDTKLAMSIIQNMEAFERWRLRRRLFKKPRVWVSMGTEEELNIILEQRQDEPVDVEVQSVYPIVRPEHLRFKYRKSGDARDGYIELLPSESVKFENVTRKRITIGIQSAPPMVNRQQQTNPTFPSNAWSQYLYEIADDDLALDASDEEVQEGKELEATRARAASVADEEKPAPEVSDQIKLLLNTLEFNQIDAYRDDYQYICGKNVDHYTNPYLEEFLCFANISKSNQRYVAGVDWYPNLAGLIAVSYAFSTPATISEAAKPVNWVQRAVLQPNPILLWSFSDNLNYQLEFEAPFETMTLSFCPYNGDLLFGGSKNGQVVIWDLQSRADRLDEVEYLTAAQAKYRVMVSDYLRWTFEIREDAIIQPATITPLEFSPKDTITGFYWLSNQAYVNNMGKVFMDPDEKNKHKFFLTCAIDGTISFWDLDSTSSKKSMAAMRSRNLPKELSQSESNFKNKMLKPTYNLGFNEPVTALVADSSVYKCVIKSSKNSDNDCNYATYLVAKDPTKIRQSMILSTFYGRIHRIDWIGMYTDTDAKETVNSSLRFAMVHDGPVISMSKNPFYTNLFASIGRNVLAIWKEDYSYSAVFWRKRPCDLTAVSWSETRPAVLYITRIDGVLEAWDILSRDDEPCLSEILGGGIITAVTEHKPSIPNKKLGIGDYNSSIRMVKLPETFDVPLDNELSKVVEYVLSEERRKVSIQAWEQKYYEINKDIIEAKREAEIEARKEMDRLGREEQLQKHEPEESRESTMNQTPISSLPYPERMARLWDELNLNRMMTILMSRKQMDPEKLARETALEKERLSYEHAKKESLAQVLLSIADEIATVRARILPAEVPDLQRSEMIQARVKDELEMADSYENISEDAMETLLKFAEFDRIDYVEFLSRGRHRRQLLDQSLGGTTERALWYERMNREILLNECNWGFDFLFTMRGNAEEEAARFSAAISDVIEFEDTLDVETED